MQESLLPRLSDGPEPLLEVAVSRLGHRLVLGVAGEVDIGSADLLREALAGAVASDAGEVWVELTDVEFMDSSGLTAIMDAYRLLEARRFALICPPGPARRVFELAGVDRVIPICPDRFAANAALRADIER